MPKPFDVSVITVSFNLLSSGRREQMLRCLESIRSQQDVRIEHLVIDGASTDGTLDFLKSYENQGWIKIFSEPDKGIYDAFNRGIAKAQGEYVCFINSDDYLNNPAGLAEAVKALRHSRADFSYSPVSYEKGGKIIGNDEKDMDFRTIFGAMACCHQGMVFKRSLFERVGLHNIKYKISADYDFILRSLLKGASFVKVPVSYAVFGKDGLSGTHMDMLNAESVEVKREVYGCSKELAQEIEDNRKMPLGLLLKILSRTSLPNKHKYLFYWKHYEKLKQLRHWLLTFRLRKGRRVIRIMGINLINEDK